MKTKSFIFSIIFFVLTTGLAILGYLIVADFKTVTGAQSLALIVLIPMAIAFALLMLVFNSCSIILSLISIRSISKPIMIISIIILVLSVALLGFNIYNEYMFISVF